MHFPDVSFFTFFLPASLISGLPSAYRACSLCYMGLVGLSLY